MAHLKWMYLAGAAAGMCSSVAVADTLHGFCSDCVANSTLSVTSGTTQQMNFGFRYSGNRASGTYNFGTLTPDNRGSALFETDRVRFANDQQDNDQQGDNQQGDDQQGDDQQGDNDNHPGKGQQGKGDHGNGEQDNDQNGNGQPEGKPSGGKPSSGKPGNGKPGTVGSTNGHGVPEPSTATLLAAALLGFGIRLLRRRLTVSA